jgi:hypothetical protein
MSRRVAVLFAILSLISGHGWNLRGQATSNRVVPASLRASVTADPADTTRVMVRVLARDAKLVGSGVGGALVTVTDVATGRVLAEGRHTGGTGDTPTLMSGPRTRGSTLFHTPGAAGFLAMFVIDEPTVVEIAAQGPGDPESATMRASKTLLIVPGRDVLGDGVTLELHGFRVELVEPAASPGRAGSPIEVAAKITMMCGCPTEPGGLWNSDGYEILARLLQGDRVLAESPLAFTGTTSHFAGRLTPLAPGTYTLEVLAVDTAAANSGRSRREIVVR